MIDVLFAWACSRCCSCFVAGGTPSSCAKPPPRALLAQRWPSPSPCGCKATMKQVWSRSLMVHSGSGSVGVTAPRGTMNGRTHAAHARLARSAKVAFGGGGAVDAALHHAGAHSKVSQRERIHSLFDVAEVLGGRGWMQAGTPSAVNDNSAWRKSASPEAVTRRGDSPREF